MPPIALTTSGLCKHFGSIAATDRVDFALPVGARHALIGPNGAGKSSFINLLTGALRPSAGTIRLGDQDVTRISTERRVKLGLCRTFQINTLFPGFTPLESAMLAICERRGIGWNAWSRLSRCRDVADEALTLLARFGLEHLSDAPTTTLPYGRQRLLEIVLSLALEPRVLLLDEPAAGVPRADSEKLFDAIASLPADIAVLFVEHDMDLVFRFAERITVLVAGSILCEGTPDEIARHDGVRESYLGTGAHV